MALSITYTTAAADGAAPEHSTLVADPRVDAVRAGSGTAADPFDDVAFVYDVTATTSLFVLRGAGNVIATEPLELTNGAVTRLSDGRFVVVGEVGDTVVAAILGADGELLSAPTLIMDTITAAPDVAALVGNAWVAAGHVLFGSTTQEGDIRLSFYDGAGELGATFGIDSTTVDDRNPQLATLSNGDVAVTWQRGTTDLDVYYAVYQSSGTVRVAPTLLTQTGVGVNGLNPVITATAAGFAIVSQLGSGSLLVNEIPNGGGGGTSFVVNAGAFVYSDVSVGVMPNGFLAIAYDFGGGVRRTEFFDATPARGFVTSFTVGGQNAGLVVLEDGALTGFSNSSGGPVRVLAHQLTANVTGDGANDTYNSDGILSIVNAGGGNDTLSGSGAGDTLNGEDGDDRVFGRNGDDVMAGSLGADLFNGGLGLDTVDYGASNGAVVIDLFFSSQSWGDAQGDELLDVENVIGSAFSDRLRGATGANQLRGGDGDDDLGGADGADLLDGGEGVDTADYSLSGAGVTAYLTPQAGAGGDAEGDRLIGIEKLVGSSFADFLHGDAGDNTLFGFGGDDSLRGGAGADALQGGVGRNTAEYLDSPEAVTVDLISGLGAGGDAQGDTYSGINAVNGSQFGDTLVGGEPADILSGQDGDDVLTGGLDSDTLSGGEGDDILDGGFGADQLAGGNGTDTLSYASATGAGPGFLISVDLTTAAVSGLEAEGDQISGFENVTGSNFTDRLTGTNGDNILRGLAGDDRLVGGAGADVLDGGAGINDEVSYADSDDGVVVVLNVLATGGHAEDDTLIGVEHVIGSAFGDQLAGTTGANVLFGGDGFDRLSGDLGADRLDGGAGTDFVSYRASAVGIRGRLDGGANLGGDAAGDTLIDIEGLIGSLHNDVLIGSAGVNQLAGDEGADTLVGGAGADQLNGGDGVDTAAYDLSGAGVTVRLGGSAGVGGDAQGDTLSEIENLTGSGFADTLAGDAFVNTLTGGLGGDTLQGGLGNDRLNGGDGADVLQGGGGRDTIDGGAGADAVDYREETLAVVLTLAGATATLSTVGGLAADSVRNAESIYGGSGGDIFTGDAAANFINGFAGNDVLKGGGGNDRLLGSIGVDTADYRDKTAAVSVTLNGASDATVRVGGVAEDVINTIEIVYGGAVADALTGDALANLFRGGGGADVINGGGGVDALDFRDKTSEVRLVLAGALEAVASVGGAAEDRVRNVEDVYGGSAADILVGDAFGNLLVGGGGNDTLRGAGGVDRLTGGLGVDVFQFNAASDSTVALTGRDTITDFSRTQGDKINLRLIDANAGLAGDQAFVVGALAVGQAGRLSVTADGAGKWLVRGDVNGDGAADFAISVVSPTALAAIDFVL